MSSQPNKLDERVIKGGIQYRSALIKRSDIDDTKRTVELSFSSEAPVMRWDWNVGGDYLEVLDHSAGSANFDRVNSGVAPLLVNHNDDDLVGVGVEASIVNNKGRAVVRFGNSPRAQEIFQDVKDGIRTAASFGYKVYELTADTVKDGLTTMRATSWEVYELTLAAVPADMNVGVGRSARDHHNINIKSMKLTTPLLYADAPAGGGGTAAPAVTAPGVTAADQNGWRKAETLRAQEIRAIAKRTGKPELMELAETAIERGENVDEFRRVVFERAYPQAKPLDLAATPEIGMSRKEISRYSLVRAINMLADKKPLDGLEREASEATAKIMGRDAGGFWIPFDIQLERRAYAGLQQRALTSGTPSEGGYTVQTDVMTGSLIELLRARMVTAQLGATMLGGLVGNAAIPRVSGGATCYWLSETATVAASQAVFGQLLLTPKRLVAVTPFSKTLLVQSSLDIENFVRDDIFRSIAVEKDKAAIQGTGGASPTGITNQSGLATAVSFAVQATPTWNEVVSFETNVATANADMGKLGYLTNAAGRGRLKTTPKTSGQAFFIWENDPAMRPGMGIVNGYQSMASQQCPSDNNLIFGNWADLVIGDWAGVDVVVDPYSLSTSNQVQIVVTIWADSGLRHSASFCVSGNAIQ